MEQHLTIERSIIKKYRKQIWNRFIQGSLHLRRKRFHATGRLYAASAKIF